MAVSAYIGSLWWLSTPKPVQITITPASARTGVTTPVVLTQMAATTETTAPQVV
jgi:hypothetical protein